MDKKKVKKCGDALKISFVDIENKCFSIRKQCDILGLNRANIYYKPKKPKDYEKIITVMKTIHLNEPTAGKRKIFKILIKKGYKITLYRTKMLMKENKITAIVLNRGLTKTNKEHKKYPYLLRNLKITRKNQVWATDITYLRLKGSYVYLMAIIDIFSRKILSWGISQKQDAMFCVNVLTEALRRYGTPEIFNTDQGSQYTSKIFTGLLKANNIKISMDGVGRALDNIYIERFWRTFKYEEFYLKEYKNLKELKKETKKYIDYYNKKRLHSSLDYETPEYYYNKEKKVINIDVYLPHRSWKYSLNILEKESFERCVEIYRNGISKESHLKIA